MRTARSTSVAGSLVILVFLGCGERGEFAASRDAASHDLGDVADTGVITFDATRPFDAGEFADSGAGSSADGGRGDLALEEDAGLASDSGIEPDSGLSPDGGSVWMDVGADSGIADMGTRVGDPCPSSGACSSPQHCAHLEVGSAPVCTVSSTLTVGGYPCPAGTSLGYAGLFCLPDCQSDMDCYRLTGFICDRPKVCQPPIECGPRGGCPTVPGFPLICDRGTDRCVPP